MVQKRFGFISFTDGKIRHASDYDDFYVISVGEVQDQISNAEKFITDIGVFLEQQYEK